MKQAPPRRRIDLPAEIRHPDQGVDRHIREVNRALAEIAERAVIGRLVETDGSSDVVLVNGAVNKLLHRLGRKLVGWQVIDLRTKDGTALGATGRITRVLKTGQLAADDRVDLWLDVQGWGQDPVVRIRVT